MIGSSVVPGLPNIFTTPSSLSTRRKASRPVMVLLTRASGIGSSSSSPPPSYGGGQGGGRPQARSHDRFTIESSTGLSPSGPAGHLPRMTGEAIKARLGIGRGAKADMTELEKKIAGLACWRGEVDLAPLKGGLTNISFVATDSVGKFVVRCGEDIPVHHVFRDRERAAAHAAHVAGLSPEIVHAEP